LILKKSRLIKIVLLYLLYFHPTLGDWLIGQNQDGGAHLKYEPNDIKFDECKKRLHDTITKKTKKSKFQVYSEICIEFHPVFRYFFMETFTDPTDWFQKKLNYTKSVATSSIVGKFIIFIL
jgi:ataxia telangiectasia mutated family protein